MAAALDRKSRMSFWLKVAAAAALVAYAEWVFFGHRLGATIGVFALIWTAAVLAARPELRRDRRAWLPLVAAAAFALVQIEQPGLLAWAMFWTALATAVLLPRAGRFEDAWRWSWRLVFHVAGNLPAPVFDAFRLRRTGRRYGLRSLLALIPVLVVPIAGGAVFLTLFAVANPVIAEGLGRLDLRSLDIEVVLRSLFGAAVFTAAWSTLRPRKGPVVRPRRATRRGRSWRGAVASVLISLVVFNALFLVQNGLDVAFLWSAAPLPDGMTLAEYAHRGAYPLIATALLAGLFVLVALRPGTPTAEHPWIRRLVVLWVGQNIFLVASTMLRTIDYVQAYSLTRLRIAALLWMGLVAVGLALIVWRLLRSRSEAWLINANALAAALVLAGVTVVDLGAVAAWWNVRHAREAGGRGVTLDLCYLRRLGPSALVSLTELQTRPLDPEFRDRVSDVRTGAFTSLEAAQSDWHSWTWRGERRLKRAHVLGPHLEVTGRRDCFGRLTPPLAPAPPPVLEPGPPATLAEPPPVAGGPPADDPHPLTSPPQG